MLNREPDNDGHRELAALHARDCVRMHVELRAELSLSQLQMKARGVQIEDAVFSSHCTPPGTALSFVADNGRDFLGSPCFVSVA